MHYTDLLNELEGIDHETEELQKLIVIERAAKEAKSAHQANLKRSLAAVTEDFKRELRDNTNTHRIVDAFAVKFIKDGMEEEGKEMIYSILAGEAMCIINGMTHSQ